MAHHPTALPHNLIDLILAMAPKMPLESTTSLSLFNVLPYRLVPAATQSVLHKAFVQCKPIADPYLNAANFAKYANAEVLLGVIDTLYPLLSRDFSALLRPLVGELCRFGRQAALRCIHCEKALDLGLYSALMALRASEGGHVQLLQWIVAEVKTVDREFSAKEAIVAGSAATRNGHAKILDVWIGLEPTWLSSVPASQAFDAAAESGVVAVLDWWKSRRQFAPDSFPQSAWIAASKNGHVNVLDWAVKSFKLPESCEDSLHAASKFGHITVLEWWLRKLGHLECTIGTLTFATSHGHIHVLDWWSRVGEMPILQTYILMAKDPKAFKWWKSCPAYLRLTSSKGKGGAQAAQLHPQSLASFGHVDPLLRIIQLQGLEGKLATFARIACASGQTPVLQALASKWQFEPIQEEFHGMKTFAASFGHVVVLQWLESNFPNLAASANWKSAVTRAMRSGHIQVLDWLWANDHIVDISSFAPFKCETDSPLVLDWLLSHGVDLSASLKAIIEQAVRNGHVGVLEWIERQAGVGMTVTFPRSTYLVDRASANGHRAVLDFLSHETLTEFEWSEYAIREAVQKRHLHIVKWWLKSGRVKDRTLTQLLEDAIRAQT